MGLLSPRRPTRRALTAASTPAVGKLGTTTSQPLAGSIAQAWQQDAQAFYDTTGPLKYAAMYRGNMYRRVRLYAAVLPDNEDDDPISIADILDPDHEAAAPAGIPEDLLRQAQVEFARIRHPKLGRAGLLYDWGVNLTIAGDSWLVAEPDDYEPSGETWAVYSVTELIKQGTWPDHTIRWQLIGPPNRPLPYGTTAWRIYNPHPHRHQMADSPTMGVLDDLEELALIRRSFRSGAKSRITGSGLLLVPDELDFGTVDPDDPDSPSKFDVDLLKHFTAPLADEASAANQMPHLVRGASDYLKPDVFRHIPFDRPGDAILDQREDKGLNRFAIGMDTPPEIILGIGDTNHWQAWQVSESSWKAHGEPGMIGLCAQIGGGPLRTLLTAASETDPAITRWPRKLIGRIGVWFNPHALIDHPDQYADATKAHDALVLSDAALRKYGNFTDQDKPTDLEIEQRVERYRLMHARGAVPGEIPVSDVAGPGAPQNQGPPPSGPPAETPAPATPQPQQARTAAAAPTFVDGSRVGQRLADVDLALFARVHGMCQTAVRRQLERAGAQITSRAQKHRQVLEVAKQTPKHRVAATLGRTVVADLGLSDVQLAGDWTDLLDQVDTHVDRSRKAGLGLLLGFAQANGVRPPDLTEYEARTSRADVDGRRLLEASLTEYVVGELYDSEPTGDLSGEGVPAGEIPPGLVRSALAVYGGQQLDENGRPDDGEPVRGVAGGEENLSVGRDLGIVTEVYQWIHGGAMNPFPPHEALDGEVFGENPDEDSDRLANTDNSWLGSTSFFPGDHAGCSCWVIPLISWAPSAEADAA